MVKKPIFDAAGNQIGEGLVEQIVTMRTDESFPNLQSMQNSVILDPGDDLSELSMTSQEKAQFELFLKEQGTADVHISKDEYQQKIRQWLNAETQDKAASQVKERLKKERARKKERKKAQVSGRSSVDKSIDESAEREVKGTQGRKKQVENR